MIRPAAPTIAPARRVPPGHVLHPVRHVPVRILAPTTDGAPPQQVPDPDESPAVALVCDLIADILASALLPEVVDSAAGENARHAT